MSEDRFLCPTCGYRSRAAGSVLMVVFDENLEGTRKLLTPRSLMAACEICGTVHVVYRGFFFWAPNDSFAVIHNSDADAAQIRNQVQEEIPDLVKVVVDADIDRCRKAVQEYIGSLANQVLVPLVTEGYEDNLEEWFPNVGLTLPRPSVSAAVFLMNRGEPDDPAAIDQFRMMQGLASILAMIRTSHAAENALRSANSDVFEAIDAALPAALLNDVARQLLVQVAGGEDSETVGALACALVLAWRAERTHSDMTAPEGAAWTLRVLQALAGIPGMPPLKVDIDVLRRTLVPARVLMGLSAASKENPELAHRAIQELINRGFLSWDQVMDRIPLGPTPEEDRNALVALAERADPLALGFVLGVLGRRGFLDDAVDIYERRRPALLRTAEGTDATKVIVEQLQRHRRVEQALALGNMYLEESGEDWSSWLHGSDAVSLLNELGNVGRLLQNHSLAEEFYRAAEQLLPESEQRETQEPVLVRNLAIVLRETGRVGEARNLLLRLLARRQPPQERALTLQSLGICLLWLGEFEAAAETFDEGLALVSPVADLYPAPWLHLLTAVAQCAAVLSDFARTRTVGQQAVAVADALDDIYIAAAAATLVARMAIESDDSEWPSLVADAERRIVVAEERLDESQLHLRSLQLMRASLLYGQDRADELVRLAQTDEPDDWQIPGAAALTLLRTGDVLRARPLLDVAWDRLLTWLAGDSLQPQDIGVLRTERSLQTAEATLAAAMFRVNPAEAPRLIRAAELGSGITGGLLSWPTEERERAVELLEEPERLIAELPAKAAIVLAVQSDWAVHLAIRGKSGWAHVGDWQLAVVERAKAEVAAVTRRAAPNGDPLPRSPAWMALADELSDCLAPHLDGAEMVLFLPGPLLTGLPLHTITFRGSPLCQTLPFAYTSSLLQLAGLSHSVRKRETSLIAGLVSAPRARDLPEAREAMLEGAERFRAILRSQHIPLEQLVDTDATPERVAELFAEASLLLLSCHGQGQPAYGRHGVLLAHDGQLPPILLGRTPDSPGYDFLLSWDDISPPTPEVFISAACSSGSASFGLGGERVSLDRSLLAAGTRLFFGPLWDVDLADAHTLALNLVERYLAGAATWAHAWQQVVSEEAGDMSPVSWQSFIIFGQWNYRLTELEEDRYARTG